MTGGSPALLVGGLGFPHDDLVAAALAARGQTVRTLGAFDDEALDRGRSALPRGQCAPMLYTTGALLRAAEAIPDPLRVLSIRSCGPCRYALFESGQRRALTELGRRDVSFLTLDQDADGLLALFGTDGVDRLLSALAVADVLAEMNRRLAPHVSSIPELDATLTSAASAICDAVAAGGCPIEAMAARRDWHRDLARRPARPLARALLVGEPWSLHVQGDGQLNLPRVLARAGVETEAPPFALWLRYLAWQLRAGPWGAQPTPCSAALELSLQIETRLCAAIASAAQAAGLGGFSVPDPTVLAHLASPFIDPVVRGGYGHVEIGLAVRARIERRAHLVLSVKSFGCIPSSGVSDAILPTALEGLPHLAVEVCGDGEAARESRLVLRVASALHAAEAEMSEAHGQRVGDRPSAEPSDPLAGLHEGGRRPYACSLACDVGEMTRHPGGVC